MGKVAGALAVIGGAMLIIGGFSGWTQLDRVRSFVEMYMPESETKENVVLALNVLILFALLGGVSVVLGGVLIYKKFSIAGRLLIALGAGVGIVTLVLHGAIAYATGRWDSFVESNMTMIGVGLALSAVARWLA
ncbi:MAG: hypothetical protein ACUVV6_02860 [Thermoplasmatota archaeon]